MIVGHVPAGYLCTKLVERRVADLGPALFAAGIAGAVAPDLDMLWFWFVDSTQHHHKLFPHFPIVWLAAGATSGVWFAVSRSRGAVLGLVFAGNGLVHLVLDSIVGDVWWFAPFVDRPYALFTVSRTFEPWWLNFLLHWTFLLELGMWVAAAAVARRSSVGRPGTTP